MHRSLNELTYQQAPIKLLFEKEKLLYCSVTTVSRLNQLFEILALNNESAINGGRCATTDRATIGIQAVQCSSRHPVICEQSS